MHRPGALPSWPLRSGNHRGGQDGSAPRGRLPCASRFGQSGTLPDMRSELVRRSGWIGLGLAIVGGALALANRALLLDDLPPTLPGSMSDWIWRGWRVRYTTLGSGPPLVLVHGLHAAASSFELRNIFEPLSQHHTVYALDLLGFGKSERPDAPYSGAFYRDLLLDFLGEVVKRPSVAIASSLSSGYAVDVARSRPDLIDR